MITRKFVVDEIDKFVEKQINQGWVDYHKYVVEKNRKSNDRILKVLYRMRGPYFVADLMQLMKIADAESSMIMVTRRPEGQVIVERRLRVIRQTWVNTLAETPARKLSVQIDPDRYIFFHY